MDWWLDATALAGILLSTLVLVLGRSNMLISAALWMLYHSIVNVGQVNYFYSQWMNDIGIIGRYMWSDSDGKRLDFTCICLLFSCMTENILVV